MSNARAPVGAAFTRDRDGSGRLSRVRGSLGLLLLGGVLLTGGPSAGATRAAGGVGALAERQTDQREIVWAPAALPNGTVGVRYGSDDSRITAVTETEASGTTYLGVNCEWSAVPGVREAADHCAELPPGLVLLGGFHDGKLGGFVSGTPAPTKAGVYTFTVGAGYFPTFYFPTDPARFSTKTYTVTIVGALAKETRVEQATFDFEERAARRESELKGKALTLAREKDELEEFVLPAANARAERALEAEAALAPQMAEVTLLLDATRRSLEQLRQEENAAPERIQGLLRAEAAAVAEIAKLESQILARSGDVAAARAERDRALRGLRATQKELAARVAGTPLGDLHAEWVRSLVSLGDALAKLQEARSAAQEERVHAEAQTSRGLAERTKIDQDLVDVVARLEGFDPAVREVTVEAAGKKVFHAVSRIPFEDILRADRAIASARRALAELDAARSVIREAFFQASRETAASELALARLLNRLAWTRFATDLGFDVYDILSATSKGGVIGAFTEFGAKLVDRYVLPKMYPRAASDGFAPGSIEARVNAEFKAELRNAWSQDRLVRLASDRVLKETRTKAAKRTAQKWVVEALEKLSYTWRQRVLAGSFVATESDSLYRVGRELRKINKRAEALKKGFTLKSLAESVFKDILKTGLNGAYDIAERNAWIDFFEKEALRRTFAPLYFKAMNEYWKAYENLERRLADKAKLLDGLDPTSGMRTTLSAKFKTKTALTITVKVAAHSGPDDLQVLVDGAGASRASVKKTADAHTLTYRLTLSSAGPTVTLVLR